MADAIKYNEDPKGTELLIKSKAMDLESGLLGKIFGAPTHSPANIAGLAIILLLVPGIILLFVQGSTSASDYWTLILPIITLALGYIFGKNT